MCNFPFTGQYCNITFEDYLYNKGDKSYIDNQLYFCIFGALSFAFSFITLMIKDNTQNNVFKLNLMTGIIYSNIINSFTFIIRGLDPKSFGNVLPFSVTELMWDISTATIYTMVFLLLFYWIKIINQFTYNKPTTKCKIITLNIIIWFLAFLFVILQSVYVNTCEYLIRGIKLFFNVFVVCGLLISVDIVLKDIIPIACNYFYSSFNGWRTFLYSNNLKNLKFIIISLHLIGVSTILYNIIFASILFSTKKSDNVELPINGITFSYFGLFQALSIIVSLIIVLLPTNYSRV